jgi:O-acetylhomoserine (thiol)-lyase
MGTRQLDHGSARPGKRGTALERARLSVDAGDAHLPGESDPSYLDAPVPDPMTLQLEAAAASTEGGIGAVATSSGILALSGLMTGLLRPGDELLVVVGLVGTMVKALRALLTPHGAKLRLANPEPAKNVHEALTRDTRAIFVESIGNPGLEVQDFWALAEAAQRRCIPLIVDNTAATPALFRPGEFGADLVVRAVGGFSGGYGASFGGTIVDTGRFDWANGPSAEVAARARLVGPFALLAHLRSNMARVLGATPSRWSSQLMLREMESLEEQVHRSSENARCLALALQSQTAVEEVGHPGVESSPNHTRAREYFDGHGGAQVTLRLGSQERALQFIHEIDNGRMSGDGPATRIQVVHPASTIASDVDFRGCEHLGAPPDMVLLCVGGEAFANTAEHVRRALARIELLHRLSPGGTQRAAKKP